MTSETEPHDLDRRAWRASWLLATTWLVFLVFPILSVWLGDDVARRGQIAATVVIAVFALVYAIGFRHTARSEVFASPGLGNDAQYVARILAALILLTVVGFAVGGWGMLGLVPYIPAYAVFNVSWRSAIITIAASMFVVVALPLFAGVYTDLWPLTPAVGTAALGTGLGRLTEERARERGMLQTELLLSDDRNRVARDVHDVLGHSLTAVVLKAELTQRLLDQLQPSGEHDQSIVEQCRAEVAELQAISRSSLNEIRSTVGGLRNPNLVDEIAAARTVLSDAGITYTSAGDTTALPPEARGALAWVVREAITNVVRHSGASHCTVTLAPTDGIWLRVEDDGVGPEGIHEGNGITGLRERLAPLDAEPVIRPGSNGGTRLDVLHG